MIKAQVVADSISPNGSRLTTLECTFHRFILPEVNTYRMWSRSAASSRAIPVSRRIEEVQENPAIPVEWGKNQRGMVAEEIVDDQVAVEASSVWREAAQAAADYATYLDQLSIHKQIVNRVLEPFSWHTSVISATDWQNMFNQRIHPDSQPEFRELAEKMFEALEGSTPAEVGYNGWHLPYVYEQEEYLALEIKRKLSVARVARTSYLNQKTVDIEKDLNLYDRLLTAEPPHLAPFEMVARPIFSSEDLSHQANYIGWVQLRHLIEKEKKNVGHP